MVVMRPLLPPAPSILAYLHRIDASRIYSNYGPLWQEFHDGFQAWLSGRTDGFDPGGRFHEQRYHGDRTGAPVTRPR